MRVKIERELWFYLILIFVNCTKAGVLQVDTLQDFSSLRTLLTHLSCSILICPLLSPERDPPPSEEGTNCIQLGWRQNRNIRYNYRISSACLPCVGVLQQITPVRVYKLYYWKKFHLHSHLHSYPVRTSRGTAACEAAVPFWLVHSILLVLLWITHATEKRKKEDTTTSTTAY